VTPFLEWVGNTYLRLFGWKTQGELPPDPKFVAVLAHHTSGWDAPLIIAASLHFKVPAYWVGKHTLFRGPLGWLLQKFGGIPVDRRSSHNMVDQIVQAFDKHEEFVFAIAPEGTRTRTDYWKTGFYHIAMGAHVPILLAMFDYSRRLCILGPMMQPSGDIEADMAIIREHYEPIKGRYPERQGIIALDPAKKSQGSQ
jgi:1-acyl-sn-glycerol-3-phosphate acyltransferase